MENFTRQSQLIEEIPQTGWLANPGGRQGYEVILLERIGDSGTRFYGCLKPGETLRVGERVFGKYTVLAVDMRHARAFQVEGSFSSIERGRKIAIRANIRYHVTDARVVAMETLDPLAELRDKVLATLVRELANFQEAKITPSFLEKTIRSVGNQPHLGLMVEDVEILQFTPDSRLTDQIIQSENIDHEILVSQKRQRAELEAESRKKQAEIVWKQEKHKAIQLNDLNVLMHEYPELIPGILKTFTDREQALLQARISVVGPAIQAYIEQQKEIDAEIDPIKIAGILRDSIEIGRSQSVSPFAPPQIVWGGEFKSLEAGDNSEADKKGESEIDEKDDDPGRIKFGN